MGKASTRAQNKYIAKAYDRINLTVPKGDKDKIKAYADSIGESVNGFIGRAIQEKMTGSQGADGLPAEVMQAAKEAAEATGEAAAEYIARAVEMQAGRDKAALAMGVNPAGK